MTGYTGNMAAPSRGRRATRKMVAWLGGWGVGRGQVGRISASLAPESPPPAILHGCAAHAPPPATPLHFERPGNQVSLMRIAPRLVSMGCESFLYFCMLAVLGVSDGSGLENGLLRSSQR